MGIAREAGGRWLKLTQLFIVRCDPSHAPRVGIAKSFYNHNLAANYFSRGGADVWQPRIAS